MIEIKEIMKILPHRYPFLLVDRIESLKKGEEIVDIIQRNLKHVHC